MSSASSQALLTGHCLCGRTRYQATATPLWVGYCHCPSCRRATGSVIAAYAGFRPENLVFEGEPPARFASSPDVIRRFCGTCGTPLSFESPRWPGEIHLLVGSADHFDGLQPKGHAFCEYQVPWFEVADELPRHHGFPSQSST
jgi:hypothetical protein